MLNKILCGALLLFSLFLWGCKSNGTSNASAGGNTEVKTPAMAVTVSHQSMQVAVWLNATSTILKKSPVKSTINGYIISSSLLPGQSVKKGQALFVLKTKEAQVIGSMLPDSLKFSGKIIIRASQSGYISQLDHQQGDFVQIGERLCIIADRSSYVFMLQVPFSLSNNIHINSQVAMMFPGGQQVKGKVTSRMPSLDSASQTQRYFIKTDPSLQLPVNLIAKVKIITKSKQNVPVLPKAAVLSDESQSAFWVMKMINDTTAIKVPINKGLEDSTEVEIISPQFSSDTKILNSGNYGLPDTAFVTLTGTSQKPHQ